MSGKLRMVGSTDLDVLQSVVFRLANAAIKKTPFPHFYVQEIFPVDYYKRLVGELNNDLDFAPIEHSGRVTVSKHLQVGKSNGSGRGIIELNNPEVVKRQKDLDPFWAQVSEVVCNQQVTNILISRFRRYLRLRFNDDFKKLSFSTDSLLIRDNSNYCLGPHTDSPKRAIVLIFYLPDMDHFPELGTSIYVPRNEGFVCQGGPHYDFQNFKRVYTAPYMPNSAFGFVKTSNSFHGVEPFVGKSVERNLIHHVLCWER